MQFLPRISIIFIACFLISSAYASSCGFKTRLNFQDGSTGCIEDLPFANHIGFGKSDKVIDVINNTKNYVIALSKTPQCRAVAVSKFIHIGGSQVIPNIAAMSTFALDSCMNQGCDCEVIIADGNVLVDKERLLSGRSLDLPPQSIVNQVALKDKEKALSIQRGDDDRIAALRKELEKEIRASIKNEAEIAQADSPQKLKIAPAIFANRKALVIGNDSYQKVTPLVNAREDARVIAESLASLGYKVSLKLDVTEKQFKSELRTFKNQVLAGDEVAIFFAGHGVQIASTNYLLPIDIGGQNEEEIKDEGISLQRLLDDMHDKRSKFTLAMIDACRDNPFKGSGRSVIGSRGLAPTTAATGQMIVFSAGSGQQALDRLSPSDKSKNGLFTRIFVKEMQKPGISVDRVVRNVRSEVVALAKSVGHDQVPAIYDQVVGEFYFKQ